MVHLVQSLPAGDATATILECIAINITAELSVSTLVHPFEPHPYRVCPQAEGVLA